MMPMRSGSRPFAFALERTMRIARCRSCHAVTCFMRPFGRGVRYFIVTTVMPFAFR